jgi:hypothetical protein
VTVPPEARALADATLRGDYAAAAALADWVQENVNSGRKYITVRYVEKLEDAIRETKRTIRSRLTHKWDNQTPGRFRPNTQSSLIHSDLERLTTLYFNLEREANHLGRGGSW